MGMTDTACFATLTPWQGVLGHTVPIEDYLDNLMVKNVTCAYIMH